MLTDPYGNNFPSLPEVKKKAQVALAFDGGRQDSSLTK